MRSIDKLELFYENKKSGSTQEIVINLTYIQSVVSDDLHRTT